jgi:hypothetical protein
MLPPLLDMSNIERCMTGTSDYQYKCVPHPDRVLRFACIVHGDPGQSTIGHGSMLTGLHPLTACLKPFRSQMGLLTCRTFPSAAAPFKRNELARARRPMCQVAS